MTSDPSLEDEQKWNTYDLENARSAGHLLMRLWKESRQRLEEAEAKLKEHKDVIRALRKQRDETDQLIVRVWQFIRDSYGIGSDINDPEQIRSHLRENGYFREQWRRRFRSALHTKNGLGEFTESGGLFPSDIDLIVETILDTMNLHDSKDES